MRTFKADGKQIPRSSNELLSVVANHSSDYSLNIGFSNVEWTDKTFGSSTNRGRTRMFKANDIERVDMVFPVGTAVVDICYRLFNVSRLNDL